MYNEILILFLKYLCEKFLFEIWYSCSNFVAFATIETKSNKIIKINKFNNTQSIR